jgi:hypothetical protein
VLVNLNRELQDLVFAAVLVFKKKFFATSATYMGADKSLAQPGRKQATATEDFEFYISYL